MRTRFAIAMLVAVAVGTPAYADDRQSVVEALALLRLAAIECPTPPPKGAIDALQAKAEAQFDEVLSVAIFEAREVAIAQTRGWTPEQWAGLCAASVDLAADAN